MLVSRVSTAGVAQRGRFFFVVRRLPGTSIGESWEFPGGKNRAGETPQETLVREFSEELSLEVTVRDLLYRGSFRNREKEYDLQAFSIDIMNDAQLQLKEHSDYAWLSLDQLSTLPMAESDRQIVDFLLTLGSRSYKD